MFLQYINNSTTNKTKKKNTLVFGNAGDKKNLHSGGRQIIFFKSIYLNVLNKF